MKYNDNGIWKELSIKTMDTLPIGIVIAFAGENIPTDWLECDGSAISRTVYATLFGVIGTSYGEGDGSTTFNLPNLTGDVTFIIKATKTVTGEYISETLPIGTELDFNGESTDIPDGWEQISDGIKLLWTNTSPESAFASQTITLSSDDYDFYEVYFTYNELSAIQYVNGFKSVKGKGMIVSENGYTTGLSVRRKVDYVDATHLLISNAYAGTDANQNGYLIPIYVVGYKTGIFNQGGNS